MIILKFIRIFLTVAIGLIYIPLNTLNNAVKKWYFSIKDKDKFLYYAFAPFYWILVFVNFIISIPYESLIAVDLH